MTEEKVARRVRYRGRVQGVGFRYTTAAIAEDHPVVGYVKNLADGRVELHAEGTAAAVNAFLDAVRIRWKRYIEQEEVEEVPASEQYRQFRIAY